MERACHRCGRGGGELTACEAGCGRWFHSPACDGYRGRRGLVCYPCYRGVDEARLEEVRRAEGEMTVRVVDGAGEPVPQARVAAGNPVEARLDRNRFTWHTPANGTVRIRRWLQPDPFVIVAGTPTRRAWRVVHFDEELRELELELEPTYSITHFVSIDSGLWLPGVPIRFESRHRSMLWLRFAGLLPGTYWLRRCVGHWWFSRAVTISDRDVYVKRERRPPGGRLEIESELIGDRDRVLLVPRDSDDLDRAPYAEATPCVGGAVIEDVPAGDWTLRIERRHGTYLNWAYETRLERPLRTTGEDRTVVHVVS